MSGCKEESSEHYGNHRPRIPIVSGPDTSYVGMRVFFDITVFDPDGDRLVVFVAWGDGDTSDYGSFVPSGAMVTFEHAFLRSGTFGISARCYDSEPLYSDWSHPYEVVVLNPGQ
ncbi:hypothetical protein CH330_06850 [candidate division WOR-3 bacterium JGI_Cruoil_03_51_56]|uniref:PKD domain-containing protein n=1 Tax=candidate division WOR-3 bacterium JGI_Cruoil_03_51_56 TaxID=1973747 RepID=A0A235BRC9_UNCW3|nr:MAG: hypothetical protein CH330_06850 [candidate division WOR-3 bacterium JGI_Cruoil_03_51_56]